MKKIFISQEVLDTLFADGKAELDGDKLTIHSKGGQVYKLMPAYKLTAVEGGGDDTNKMVGKIFAKAELERIKADVYMDSVIVNDVPYHAEQGFVGVPQGETAAKPDDKPAEGEPTDEELLSDYLSKIL